MAPTVLGSNGNALHVLGVLSVLLLIQRGNAFEFRVGGPRGSWTVRNDPNAAASYNQWAEMNRFQIGDTLLFVYPADKDSVLQVTKDDYTNCNTASPIAKFSDGHTVFKLDQSGPFYFISGVAENCLKNEKLMVVVMADRGYRSKQTVPPSSPPSPSTEVPAPSPAPTFEDSPPDGVEINPAPAPGQESPKNNGAASIDMSVIGSIGTFLGSLILLLVS